VITQPRSRTDTELRADIVAELKWDPSVRESRIGVIVNDGIVTLTGTAEVWAEKAAAERATQRVYGVRAIANEIEIGLPPNAERSDADLAAAAVNAIQWHVFVPRDRVEVSIAGGWITLRGTVDWQYQKSAAEDAVRHLWGVKGVVNEIVLEPALSPQDVKRQIVDAMERNAVLDAQRVTVDAQGSRVVLSGTVPSWAEKNEAGAAAWSAPGVTEVRNDIQVACQF
jgi:osmotically-inducible protein OsmY